MIRSWAWQRWRCRSGTCRSSRTRWAPAAEAG
uniref:Uncharacterized protein n=1 Tax=Arundo donax TaxID=35708 RepID=A0A0A9E9W2_ARUDO